MAIYYSMASIPSERIAVGGGVMTTNKRGYYHFYYLFLFIFYSLLTPYPPPALLNFVPLRSNTVGEAPQLRFCWNQHRQHGGEGGGEGGGGGRGFVGLVSHWRHVYMMKRSCAEVLQIFYWARQLPARTIK